MRYEKGHKDTTHKHVVEVASKQGCSVRDAVLALMADRDCSDAKPRVAHTSADYGFRAGRHGGDVAEPYRDGSAGPSSEILVRDS
jgi:hypothetical protein